MVGCVLGPMAGVNPSGSHLPLRSCSTPFNRQNDARSPDALNVIRHVISVTSGQKTVRRRLHVAFRYPNGTVGSRDFLTHWLHPYPAKMFHRIPRQILSALDQTKHTVVLDPYCGSGTVLIEAALRGHRAVGVDVNPLARLLAEVKSTPLPPKSLQRSAERLLNRAFQSNASPPRDPFLDFWFKASVQMAIGRLRAAIENVRDLRYRRFFLVTLSSIIRRCSLADPSIAPPVRLSDRRSSKANARYRRDLARARGMTAGTVFLRFESALEKNIDRVNQLNHCTDFGRVRVLSSPAHAARTGLRRNSVDVILTSPPYCGAQKYVRSLRLELYWLGFAKDQIAAVDRETLGTERVSLRATLPQLLTGFDVHDRLIRKVWSANRTRAIMLSAYVKYLNDFAAEAHRLLRPGGCAFVTFGTSRIGGIDVDMARIFRQLATTRGLDYVTTLVDSIPSRGLMTRRHRTSSMIADEQVVWLKA